MLIGYARTSTVEQEAGLDAQKRDLKAAGCERLRDEQVSSVATRAKLELTLQELRPGDVLVVTKLDRLARSMRDLISITDRITAAGASMRILAMNLDTSTPTGTLMLNVIGSVAQFEREMMLERQREGIAKAKGEGKYRGRQPTPEAKAAIVLKLNAAGVRPTDIGKQVGVSRATVYRIIKETKPADDEPPRLRVAVPNLPSKTRVPVPRVPAKKSRNSNIEVQS
jgi:DNA invertase Pin-like site-specific DNA recombinase